MDLRPGYKQTEAGVIPEDWLDPQLQQITEDDSPICYGIVQVGAFAPNGIPVLAIKNLNLDYTSDIHRASVEVERPYARSRIRPKDILVSVKGTTGRVGIVPGNFLGNISRDLARIRPRSELAPSFLYQMLQSEISQRRLANAAVGTTRMELSIAILKHIRVPLPPTKAEQEVIAEALSDADALIESLEQLLAKKRQLKQGAMQELLTGKKRLPGFRTKTGCKQSQVGEIPNDWGVARLGDLFEITSSKRVFQSEWTTEGVPFFRAREIAVLAETGIVDNDLFISIQMYESFQRAYGVPKVGDLLVTGVGTLGKVYCVQDDREFYFKDGNIIWFKIAGAINSTYLRQLYLTPVVIKQIADSSAGTTVGTYTISGAKRTVIPLPGKVEQEAIATVLSDMDAEIAALEAKHAKARSLKQGMMQELLTGRIRLV